MRSSHVIDDMRRLCWNTGHYKYVDLYTRINITNSFRDSPQRLSRLDLFSSVKEVWTTNQKKAIGENFENNELARDFLSMNAATVA